ncbi:hypothetical protein [Caballeronia sp. SBC2]|uniref:hypothetical protein n=1 Tax=Caballeronia sp. SBC2 TaxID=2705547 RepID=UPI0013E130D2|nr:hypothetical protein [Caballeronia sp. SBC2]QIE30360.1 hypothetical protein SBC2_84370 [Caballeronia sp. SBC2]
MQKPIKEGLARSNGISFCSGDYSLNSNPRRYKYQWQVFTLDSEWEGDEFFENAPKLSMVAWSS